MILGADLAAEAALRELPEALVIAFDAGLRIILTAGQALQRLGSASSCQPGRPASGAFPAELWAQIAPLFDSALAGETRSREIWTAGDRCLMFDVGPLGAEDATPAAETAGGAGGVAVVLDITARRTADTVLAAPGSGFEEVFERAPVGTGLLDSDGRWLLVNRALCEITGYTAEELIGKRFDGIIHPEDAYNDEEQREQLLAGEIDTLQVHKRYFDAAGETVSAILSMSLVRDEDGEPLHYIAQLLDVSERKQLEDRQRRLADHDPLTGLRNRRLFEHDLCMQVARSQRYGEVAGLLLLSVDGLRQISAEHGDRAGEDALRSVARALTRRLRETDLVARIGSGEFAVLLPHIDEEGMSVVADGLARVVPACGADVGPAVLHPCADIGFALIDANTSSADEALAAAERALHMATQRPSSS